MRKGLILVILVLSLMLTGCSIKKVDANNYDKIINSYFNSNRKIKMESFSGYSLYIPRGLRITDKYDNNLVLRDKNNNLYYVYVSTVGYYNKIKSNYKPYKDNIYFKKINNKNKSGYIEVIKDNDKYFVHGTYNYVKIEVYSSKEGLSDTIINLCEVMSSIKYNKNILKINLGNEELSYKEESYNIFSNINKDNNSYLDYIRKYDSGALSSVKSSDGDEDVINTSIDED